MRISMKYHEKKYIQDTASGFSKVLKGELSPQTFHGIMGEMAKSDIQNSILDFTFLQNADSTLANKNGTRPLVNTGIMRQAISWGIDFKVL